MKCYILWSNLFCALNSTLRKAKLHDGCPECRILLPFGSTWFYFQFYHVWSLLFCFFIEFQVWTILFCVSKIVCVLPVKFSSHVCILIFREKKLEVPKGLIRSRKSKKDTQDKHEWEKEIGQKDSDLHNTIRKFKIEVHET